MINLDLKAQLLKVMTEVPTYLNMMIYIRKIGNNGNFKKYNMGRR